ncbi:hypothetical protein QR680_009161 [Steinernema hermaphroditum]|uniref:receptor protein-tyrosine kinase n=1 Tax=Steinernema hermaphroditum TaxID=289476 RepID=A0AA39IJ93_9BILA|nr:hypothetical protein QR680_009161 [Steinernema hermaphroditum]
MDGRLLWRILLLFALLWLAEPLEWRRGNCAFWKENTPCICSGTLNGRSTTVTWSQDRHVRLEQLRRQYINCTVVYGSLELTHIEVDTNNATGELDFDSVDLSFLQNIEEITGYLLIYSNAVEAIALPRLKVVWGDEKFEGAGVQIINNANLRFVSMPSFRSLETGTFNVSGNPHLCHFRDRVAFEEILGHDLNERLSIEDRPANLRFLPNFHFCDAEPPTNCSDDCGDHCWGPKEDECQIVYRSICPTRCDSGMCFMQNGETKCCDRSCAGGCYGEGKRECTACANFLQDDECVDQCNGLTKYDRIKGITVEHDRKRYTYDRYCVEKCPEETLIQGDHCVVHCSPGYSHDPEKNTRECEKCDGVCPKKCTLDKPLDALWFQNPENRDCTVIDGFLQIMTHVFGNHSDNDMRAIPALTDEDLATLQSVKVITEFVYISSGDNSPHDLSFLKNLEVIEGRRLLNQRHALVVASNTNLRELQLQKLRWIRKGDVLVNGNEWLCFADSVPLEEVLRVNGSVKVANNRDPRHCEERGLVCAASCEPRLGCWGEGPSMCVACRHFKKHGECVGHCPIEGFYTNSTARECLACHEQCEACSGPGDTGCLRCRNASMRVGERTRCVAECPKSHYRSGAICLPCAESCYENGCTGPGAFAGAGGCNLCKYAFRLDNVTAQFQCIMALEDPLEVCRDNNLTNYYLSGGASLADQYVCERCNSECLSCRQFGDLVEKSECHCRHFELRSNVASEKTRCVSDCGPGSRIEVNRTMERAGVCRRCHQLCDQKRSCSGPFEADCDACEFAGVEDAYGTLKCLPECPPELPYPDEGVCREVDPRWEEQKRRQAMYLWIAAILVATVLVCGVLGYYAKKNRRLYKQELEANPPSIPPQDPFDPSDEPNMSRLIIIPGENLTRFSEKLGEGAFGVVFKGYLYPKGKSSGKVPVAIKYLKTITHDGSAEKEMLEEAGLMASMHHKHLLKIAGICLVDGVSIVTPYRIYGCLLEFLRKHQKNLFARDLLLYCYQIADAMEYLHQNKMVHRDLAARNVLVKRPNYVEVTDFGLAKMLKKDEESVEVSGKVAPKWLALECFEKKAFNEQTDVWAFGVTCWEVLTKGCVPYKNMSVDAMRSFLEDGNRLETPNNVSQQLYSLLLLCWLTHPKTRPSFSQLKTKLEEFCRQPNRYLKDVSPKDVAQSARDMQRILESYNDSFVVGASDDEPIIDPNFYGASSFDDSPQGTPPSPSKPLLPRTGRLRSSGSTRYDTDPVYKGRPGALRVGIDDGNYMTPISCCQKGATNFYTPVIVDETGRTELSPAYYNEPATSGDAKPLYENAPEETHSYENAEMRTVSNPSYVTDPVSQKETTL